MTKDEGEFLIEQILVREIKDNGQRWYMAQEIYREVVKKAEQDAKDDLSPFLFSKPAD